MPSRPRVDRLKTLYTTAKALHFPWLLRDYPRSVLYNGIGRYVCQLQRMTIRFCKTEESSFGVRQFLEQDLLDFARANPGIVVYVQPVPRATPALVGEYLNGRKAHLAVKSMDHEEICRQINYLRTRSGQRIVLFDREQSTHLPSVQGMWHPMRNTDTAVNVELLPSEKLSEHKTAKLTATEAVMQMLNDSQQPNVQVLREDGR